jgi:O-antigen/teichoic acid export membrane protein
MPEPGTVTAQSLPSLIGKSTWSGLASLLTSAASFVSTIIVARLLGPAGAGEFAYGAWAALIASQVTGFALPQVAMRYLASGPDRREIERWIWRRTGLLLAPGAGLALAIGAASSQPKLTIAATALLAAAQMAGGVAQGVLVGAQRYRTLAWASGASGAVHVAAVAVGGAVAGAHGALLGYGLAQIPLALAALWRTQSTAAGELPAAIRVRLRSFAVQTWVAITLALVAWSRLEFAFLEERHGPEAVAMYAVALTIAQVGIQPTMLLGNALLPHFAELVGEGRDATVRETFAAVTRVLAFLAFPLCFGLSALAPTLVPVLLGPEFGEAVFPASIAVASASVVAVGQGANAIVYAHERTRFVALAGVVSAIAAVASFAWAIPRFGATGAAVARSVVQAAGVIAGFAYVAGPLRTSFPAGKVVRAALAAALAAGVGGATARMLGPSWESVAGAMVASTVAYAVAAPRLAVLDPSDAHHLIPLLGALPEPLRRRAAAFVRSAAGA